MSVSILARQKWVGSGPGPVSDLFPAGTDIRASPCLASHVWSSEDSGAGSKVSQSRFARTP